MNVVFSTPADRPYVTAMEYTLPCCGLVIRQYRADAGGDGWEKRNREALDYWAESRVSRHRCELVSAENPMGLLPRAQRKVG